MGERAVSATLCCSLLSTAMTCWAMMWTLVDSGSSQCLALSVTEGGKGDGMHKVAVARIGGNASRQVTVSRGIVTSKESEASTSQDPSSPDSRADSVRSPAP